MARLGSIASDLENLPQPLIWVHAVSLGEVIAVAPMLKAIKAQRPNQTIVVSTVTETGREAVLQQLDGTVVHCYAPLDYWWIVKRYIRTLKPHTFLLVESEIWPNLLTCLRQHHVPVCLVNGRISSTSFSRYRMAKNMMQWVWASFSLALMQTSRDAQRMRELGVRKDIIHVTGNMKFDQLLDYAGEEASPSAIRTALAINETEQVIVAGSTHEGEEELLLQAYRSLCESDHNVILVLAPRHIERTSALALLIAKYGFRCIRRSHLKEAKASSTDQEGSRVIILDSRGELPYVYRIGIVGFVGGTLMPVGGHNLLEPARWGRPVMFGPHVDHCRDIARLLLQVGGGIQVHDTAQLLSNFQRCMKYPEHADQLGRKGWAMIQENRGVVEKNVRLIGQLTDDQENSSGVPGHRSHHLQTSSGNSATHSSCSRTVLFSDCPMP